MSETVAIQPWHRRALRAMLGGATLTRRAYRGGPMSWWFEQNDWPVGRSANLHGTSWNWLEKKGLIERFNSGFDQTYRRVDYYVVTAAGLAAALDGGDDHAAEVTPLIFLDVDGVLARLDLEYRYTRLTQSCVDALGVLIERTGAEIVLSSSWRYSHTAEQFARLLADYGLTATVIGCTPKAEERESGLLVGCTRGEEIAQWLIANDAADRPFVILDDFEEFGRFTPRWVQTDHRDGLTLADVDRACALLGAAVKR